MKEVGQNADAHFDFENGNALLSCRRLDNNGVCDEKFLKDSLVLEPNGSPSGINYPAHGKGYLRVLSYYKISPLSEGSYIYVYGNQDYYINYLVNTNGSADQAKLVITDENGGFIASSVSKTGNDWERRVLKFKVGSDKSLKKIKIYLTSDTTKTQNSYVYFDDINIEPVLQVAPDKYVAKDCRLYPGTDSLSCLSANNNVVKDGLFGYCLQYDPLNTKSCLMWYPVDKIAPVTRGTQADLGYKGKFPLYYCSEANGNFQLLKKITGVMHADGGCSHCTGKDWAEATQWAAPEGTKNFNPTSVACSSLTGISAATACRCLDTASSKVICGSDNYYAIGDGDHEGSTFGPNTFDMTYFCAPNPSKFVLKGDSVKNAVTLLDSNCKITYYDGWVPYGDGFLSKKHVFSPSGGNGNTDVSESQLSDINEAENNDPGVAVWDYSNPPASEKTLVYPYNTDPDQVYRLTCNAFTQLVDAESNNMAWVDRVSRGSKFTTSTPDFFYNRVGNFSYYTGSTPALATTTVTAATKAIFAYGRNREDVPFGGAVLPSDYTLTNSQIINLRNQYSAKNNETIFAGRPYGCDGESCNRIGQCNLKPDIFCIYTNNNQVNKQSCAAAGGGECARLWDTPLNTTSAANILNTLFIKKYAEYSLINGVYTNSTQNDWVAPTNLCANNIRPTTHPASFCIVKPLISNIKMEQVQDSGKLVAITMTGSQVTINKSGLYKLSFNSEVDSEQQPLRQIIIDWSDAAGGVQIVTNADNKPNKNVPHEFYHYYLSDTAVKNLGIKIADNWEAFDAFGSLK
jgi:hypothetical protein